MTARLFRRCCGLAFVVLTAATLCLGAGPALAETPPQPPLPLILDEATLVTMLDDVVKYYSEPRASESQILTLLPVYEKNKDSQEYRKLRFLFDTHQKVTTSLNNLVDVLYIYLNLVGSKETDINEYVFNRTKNIVTFLNNMVYFLTTRNQEIELSSSNDVQKLYESYLVRLTTLLYELNKSMATFHK